MILSSEKIPPQIGMKVKCIKEGQFESWIITTIKYNHSDLYTKITDDEFPCRTNMSEWNLGYYQILNYHKFKPKTRLKFL